MKQLLKRVAVSSFVLCSTCPALAGLLDFELGDIIASTGSATFTHYKADGTFAQTFTNGSGFFTTGGAFNQGNFYGTNFSGGYITKVTGPLDPHTISTFVSAYGGTDPESIVFNASNQMYVGHADGDHGIRKFDLSGTLLATYFPAVESRGTDWIDLAADQTTMYYTSEGTSVKRYDVGADAQLADFAIGLPGSAAYALRLLADGGVLVADTESVVRLDSSGSVIQSYDVSGEDTWFSLNLDPDGTSFWSGNFGTGKLYKFDIAAGTLLQTLDTSSSDLFGVTIFGEKTQGGVVPAPGAALLGMIGLAVVQSIRRRTA
jgi:hypothetical protein